MVVKKIFLHDPGKVLNMKRKNMLLINTILTLILISFRIYNLRKSGFPFQAFLVAKGNNVCKRIDLYFLKNIMCASDQKCVQKPLNSIHSFFIQ